MNLGTETINSNSINETKVYFSSVMVNGRDGYKGRRGERGSERWVLIIGTNI